MNCMGSPEEMLEGIVKKLAADAPQKPALEDDGSQDARRAATRVLELAAEDAWEEILSWGRPARRWSCVEINQCVGCSIASMAWRSTRRFTSSRVALISTQVDGHVAPERSAGGLPAPVPISPP